MTKNGWWVSVYLGPEGSGPRTSTPLHVYLQIYIHDGKLQMKSRSPCRLQ